ncbi:esterase/lipase family protein [Alterisphingorhabdus coralli]|uniref:Alpha/beta hydrolase n=1 Tax=Alterisphingorhabdus coralli TaxID=3071408 RepID=A0AA97I0W4_9SPHN|nr:alpha/beta hydrolase [Parasphingorhabdus sp. SCSIO 66989]WOE74180.1 alpha/beta hydrolase [Parasphingorhabdus sp. SCSIO 66989]
MATASTVPSNSAKPPSLLWSMLEGRAVFELGWFYALRGAMTQLPQGDGHSVIVLPGFMASDRSTRPMRGLLEELGYDTHGWDMGRNVIINREREKAMNDLLDRVYRLDERKVSLIGWSLGGVFAREIAKMAPEKVRQVITLGSPISNDRNHSNARHLFEALNGEEPEPLRDGRYLNIDEAPPVPTTSILTKTDGVVAWRGSVQKPGPQTDNVEVTASHIGLGVNPLVMYVLADRLAQPEDDWKPFDRSGWRRMVFGEIKA